MKQLLIMLLVIPTIVCAKCDTYVVGFTGLNNAFDKMAFEQYVNTKSSCYKLYKWHQVNEAVTFVNSLKTTYEFYGFSKGASSIARAMPKVKNKPNYVVTVGAWHTTDVDFTRYNIRFTNFFDESGRKQRSPGLHISNVPHMKMQQYINELMPLWPNW